MKIIIVGGGEKGLALANLLTNKHQVTIIEQDEQIIKSLQSELDALIIQGNGIDINILKQANVKNASLFLAVTNDDNINIIACFMAKRLNKKNLIIVGKIEDAYLYFSNHSIQPKDFSINMLIDPKILSIQKIIKLIEHPEANEIVNYSGKQSQLIGIRVNKSFSFIGKSLKDIGNVNEIYKKIRIVAIYRNEEIIIPTGKDIILPKDKIYIIGRTDIVEKVRKIHFDPKFHLRNIVIIGGNKIGKELAKSLVDIGKKVTIIEANKNKCEQLSQELNNVLIIHGSGTDAYTFNEVMIENSCFVSITNDDEYNMISAVYAKKYKALKTICMIRNIALVSIIHNMTAIDAVFSPHQLTVGEILRYCRKGDIISVTSFSEINAETIDVLISEKISILNKPLQDIKFPSGMIIGVITRENKVIIPTGQDMIKLNDKVVIFVLPSAIYEVQKIFSRNYLGKF